MTTLETERVRELESAVTDWQHENDVPGVSVVLVDEDGERYAEGFGARDLESNAPATPDTLYGMGSISKALTAIAVVSLAEQGPLSLSDPVSDHVEYYDEAPGEPITVADLLSHTSGMPAHDAGVLAQKLTGTPAGVADEADRRRVVRESLETRVTDEDRFMYYNTGYGVLGRVIEAMDGREYAEYVREELFEPLGMDRATFHREPFEEDADAMTGYQGGEDGPPEATPFPFSELIHPAGGLLASTRHLGNFLRAAMANGEYGGERVWPAGVLDRCQEPLAVRQTYVGGTEQRYGYGWLRQPLFGDTAVGHGGTILVSAAFAGYLREAGLGVVVATNSMAEPHPADLGLALLGIATGHEMTDVPAFALAEKCDAVVGTYEGFRGDLTATVERASGGLRLEFTDAWGEQELRVFPENLALDEHRFYTVGPDGSRDVVEFDTDGERDDLFFRRERLRRTDPSR